MNSARTQEVKMADSRDMIGAHDMFRLHFGALPALVRNVAPGDTARAQVVSEHAQLLATLLTGHHASEDENVWPKLHERCPNDIQPLVSTMESQHEHLHTELENLVTGARTWAPTGDGQARDALAEGSERLNLALREHLQLEEDQVLRLIDTYLTDAEWKATVAAASAHLTPENGALTIGMLLDSADAPMQEIIREGVPEEFWNEVRPAALAAYESYAAQVYGGPIS